MLRIYYIQNFRNFEIGKLKNFQNFKAWKIFQIFSMWKTIEILKLANFLEIIWTLKIFIFGRSTFAARSLIFNFEISAIRKFYCSKFWTAPTKHHKIKI